VSKVAPALCSSYKGVLPSDLLEKYSVEGGMMRLEYDLAVLNEIHDQIVESQGDAKKDGARMEARRKQRRAKAQASMDDGGMMQFLRDSSFIDKQERA